jgi:NADH-quinone oxidoreductase subunit B
METVVPDVAPAMTLRLDVGRRYTLRLASFGLACCAVEFVAASVRSASVPAPTSPPADGERELEVLVVSGTVTDKIAPAVRTLYDALPEPRRVISFGACASSGGPYWDSYCVIKGVDQILPVDLYVPGCPPRPEALLHAVLQLAGTADRPRPHSTAAPVRPGSSRALVTPQDLRRRLSAPGDP